LIDIFELKNKLYAIYSSKLKFSGITLFSLFLSIVLFLYIFYASVLSNEIKIGLFIIITLHLFGLERYAKNKIKESKTTPEVLEWRCPNPKCGAILFSLHLQCSRCGTEVNPK
jgi:hypothetical protein